MPDSDRTGAIKLRIFNSEDVLIKDIDYSSVNELSKTLFDLPFGDYTIVETSKTQNIFVVNEEIGNTKLQDLCMILKKPSSSPEEAFYGVKKIKVKTEEFMPIEIQMNRVFAEIHVTVIEIPDVIIKVSGEVINTAKGFYPGIEKLTSDTADVELGKVNVVNGTAVIPTRRLMPVTNSVLTKTENSFETQGTQIEFKFFKKDGVMFEFMAQMPIIKNGGIYSHEFKFNNFMPELVLNLIHITDWRENKITGYEVLQNNTLNIQKNEN